MQRLNIYFFILLAFYCTTDLSGQRLDHVLGEVIIEVKSDRGLSILLEDLKNDPIFPSTIEAKKILAEPMNLWLLKTNPNEVNENIFLEKVIFHHQVLLAQKNHITQHRKIPDDPLFENQWQYINTGQSNGVVGADIDMDLAWDISTGGLTVDGDTIVVCIVDDGLNQSHPDFEDNIWINHQEIPGNEIDDDGNGYVDDYLGWSAFSNSDNVFVGGGHGTPVTGIVGAKGNNGVGVSGVNWDIKLMIVRGDSPEAVAIASYAYPYNMRKLYNETNGEKGAFVVSTNSSWGIDFGSAEDAPIWCEFYNMMGEVGILSFGATANAHYNVDEVGDLPTSCESNFLVSVTNLNREDEKVPGAGYGLRSIDLGAYGEQVYTVFSTSYGGFAGTSAATPHVAGTAALLYSANCPEFASLSKSNPAQAALVVKDCILYGVEHNQSLEGISVTEGGLNAFNAIQNLMSSCGDCAPAYGGNIEEITNYSGKLTWFEVAPNGVKSLRYKSLEDSVWVEIENVSPGFVIEDLNICSYYEFQTKTDCGNNPDAEYSYSRVFKTIGCCEVPTGIEIIGSGSTMTVQWSNVSSANNYVAEWRNVADTTWTIVNIGQGASFTIENVSECEFFEVRIKSECGITNNESEFSDVINFNSPCEGCSMDYCPIEDKITVDEWIESIEIVDVFKNISGPDEAGYGVYLGQFDIELTAEEEYTIILTPGHAGIKYLEFFSAYIDYNQNGEFDDNESIFISSEGGFEPVMDTFSVPLDAVDGYTRMRVIMRYDEINGPCDEFGFNYGEVEEYCVYIHGNMDCPEVITVTPIDTTLTSLTFDFEYYNGIETYLIAYREKGTLEFDTIMFPDNQVEITNLQICTEYEYTSGYFCQEDSVFNTEIIDISTLCEVSTSDLDLLAFNIYPNPTFGDLLVEFEFPVQNETSCQLLTIEGKILEPLKEIKVGSKAIIFDTQELPSGVYIFKLNVNGIFIAKKWVKY